jgi:nifR3 family TIM-barrel protein
MTTATTAVAAMSREQRTILRIGPIALRSPVVLAPMAGVTNVAFRTLCRELEVARAGTVSGLYVCEMVTARALVERHPSTLHMVTFAPDEQPRSLQLYSVDPDTTYAAARMIADEGLADHIDMNFGCPVPKVTRRGGGAALPFKRRLFGQIVGAAVRATEGADIPVTVKFRIGIDDEHHTHLDAGRIAELEGAAAVALHARTAAQRYSGIADWDQIAALKQHVRSIPVLGNGDIFDADDAVAMMAAAASAGPGCSPNFLPPSPAPRSRHRPHSVRSRGSCGGMGSCWQLTSGRTRACGKSASTSRGTCMASPPDRTFDGRWRSSRRWPS